MKFGRNQRGFTVIEHDVYPPRDGETARVVQASSSIGEHSDSLDTPGSSFLWVGDRHHLDREQVRELRDALTRWLESGELMAPTPAAREG